MIRQTSIAAFSELTGNGTTGKKEARRWFVVVLVSDGMPREEIVLCQPEEFSEEAIKSYYQDRGVFVADIIEVREVIRK